MHLCLGPCSVFWHVPFSTTWYSYLASTFTYYLALCPGLHSYLQLRSVSWHVSLLTIWHCILACILYLPPGTLSWHVLLPTAWQCVLLLTTWYCVLACTPTYHLANCPDVYSYIPLGKLPLHVLSLTLIEEPGNFTSENFQQFIIQLEYFDDISIKFEAFIHLNRNCQKIYLSLL
jgi:hypothetical protein